MLESPLRSSGALFIVVLKWSMICVVPTSYWKAHFIISDLFQMYMHNALLIIYSIKQQAASAITAWPYALWDVGYILDKCWLNHKTHKHNLNFNPDVYSAAGSTMASRSVWFLFYSILYYSCVAMCWKKCQLEHYLLPCSLQQWCFCHLVQRYPFAA